jgi:hypothetical protein
MALEPPPFDDWTEAEIWAWGRITAGEVADFNARGHEAKRPLNPTKKRGWTDSRRLRAAFLEAVATKKSFVDAIPFGGVRISGALVDDAPLNLEHARLQRSFWLEQSRVLVPIKASNLRVDGEFSLEGSHVSGDTNLYGAEIHESLYISGGLFGGSVNLPTSHVKGAVFLSSATFKREVDFTAASVGAGLEMQGSTFEGEVSLTAASVGSYLVMQEAVFKKKVSLNSVTVKGAAFSAGTTFAGEVDLIGAAVGAVLEMQGSTFEGKVSLNRVSVGAVIVMRGAVFKKKVDLNSAAVKGAVFLSAGATFEEEVNLVGASVGSNLEMQSSTFKGNIRLYGATVTGSVFLSAGATFAGEVDLTNSSVGATLDLSDSTFSGSVNLTGARITGDLRLGSARHPAARWGADATLVLRNAHAGALQDRWTDVDNNAWPKNLDLEGFAYQHLGGLYAQGTEADMLSRPSSSYFDLLARTSTDSPQPYEFLARTFRKAGEPKKANDILYKARERRRDSLKESGHWLKWLGISLLKWTMGYGLGGRYFRVLWWVIGLTLFGAVLLKVAGLPAPKFGLSLVFLSLDELLPIITLDKAHESILTNAPAATGGSTLPYWLLVYFYFHKIAGWVLGSFLVAGLAGLTQRN